MGLAMNSGTPITVMDGNAMLSAEFSPGDGRAGTLLLRLEDQSTLEGQEITLRLDPSSPDAYEIYEWQTCRGLIVCGARHIVALRLPELQVGAVVGLEYEEAETIDRPWFVESREGRLLVVATERRVWCVDDRVAIRWMWSSRSSADDRWICAPPRAVGSELHVPVRTLRGESVMRLAVDDGIER